MHASERDRARDQGFTLIELAVVTLVLGALVAVALPNLLGARRVVSDRAAQSTVRTAVLAARTTAVTKGDYSETTPVALAEAEPSVQVHESTEPAVRPDEVSVAIAPDKEAIYAVARSRTGTCFAARDTLRAVDGGTTYAALADDECIATSAAELNDAAWAPQW